MEAGVVCFERLLKQAVGKSLRTHNLKPQREPMKGVQTA